MAISTRSKGTLVNKNGINLLKACYDIEKLHKFDENSGDITKLNSMEITDSLDYDVREEQ